jgi:hypothetical protein
LGFGSWDLEFRGAGVRETAASNDQLHGRCSAVSAWIMAALVVATLTSILSLTKGEADINEPPRQHSTVFAVMVPVFCLGV